MQYLQIPGPELFWAYPQMKMPLLVEDVGPIPGAQVLVTSSAPTSFS